MKKKLSILVILSLALVLLTGCSSNQDVSLKEKSSLELDYIEGELISILNKRARGDYLKQEETEKIAPNDDMENEIDSQIAPVESTSDLDWKKILKDTENIEKSVASTVVDLAGLNIEAEEIAKFANGVDNMIIAIENEDEHSYFIELNNLYSLIPTYMERYSSSSEKTFRKKLKYYAISTYISYMDGNIEMAKTQSSQLEKLYGEKMGDMTYAQNNEYNLNKLYILIQELKKAVDAESKELVKSKYLLVISEI